MPRNKYSLNVRDIKSGGADEKAKKHLYKSYVVRMFFRRIMLYLALLKNHPFELCDSWLIENVKKNVHIVWPELQQNQDRTEKN